MAVSAEQAIVAQFEGIIMGVNVAECEATLVELSNLSGYGSTVMQIALSTDVPLPYRTLACVLFRQHVESHWSAALCRRFDPDTMIAMDADEKAAIRAQILSGLADSEHRVRGLLAAAIAKMAEYDWPEEWPDVFTALLAMLQSGEPHVVHGVLRCLDDFAHSMKADQMTEVIPLLFPELYRVFRNEAALFSARDQMRAVSVVSTCLNSLYPVTKTHTDEALALLAPTLPAFLEGFEAVLGQADAEGVDCGLKIAVLDALHVLVLRYAKWVGDALAPLLGPIWSGIVSGTAFYERAVLQDLEKPVQYSDGEPRGLEYQISSTFCVVQVLSQRAKFRPALRESLDALMHVLTFYLQLTNHQIDTFESEPAQFVEEEDEIVTRRHSVRMAADELLAQLVTSEVVGMDFAIAATAAMVGAVERRIGESSEAKAAGDPNWWRLREAAFFALGRVGDEVLYLIEQGHIEFDVPAFLEHVLLPELQADTSPYLLGRALWLASFFVHQVPQPLAEAFIAAVHYGMAAENPMPIRVCATNSMLHLCLSVSADVIAPHMAETARLLVAVATHEDSASEPVIMHSILTTLHAALKTNSDGIGAVESLVGPFTLALWMHRAEDHNIVSLAIDVFTLCLESSTACARFTKRLLPMVLSVLNQSPEEVGSYGFFASSCQALEAMYKAAPSPLAAELAASVPALAKAFLASVDQEFIQVASNALRVVLRKAAPQTLVTPVCESGSIADLALACASRLFSPDVSEDGAVMAGPLVITMLKALGEHLGDFVDKILQAVVERLSHARYLPFIQSLVLVFAFLITQQGAASVVEFLASYTCASGENGLRVLMGAWMANEAEFTGEYPMRLSLTALVALMAPMDERVQNCATEEEIVDVHAPVRTRAGRARTGAPLTRQVPAPIKIFDLLVGRVESIADDRETAGGGRARRGGGGAGGAGADDDDDAEGDSEGDSDSDDDLYESAGLAGSGGGGKEPTGMPTFMDRDAFLLTDMYDRGHGHEVDDEDEEFTADPLTALDVGAYLTAFFRAFASADPTTFHAIAGFLGPKRQGILQRTLDGEFDQATA